MNTGVLTGESALMELAPADILIPERIGFLHEDKAAALGRLMAVDGQRDPIKVVRRYPDMSIAEAVADRKAPWGLVTGMHRLMGATYEGITILALEVSGKAEDLADLEASENLHRRPLGPIERAKFTAALVQASKDRIAREHGDLKQQQLAIAARWGRVNAGEETAEQVLRDETEDTCAKFAHVYGWEDSVGEALGMSRRTIHNDLSLFRLLIEPFPELMEGLATHPLVGDNGSQLKAIAQVKDEAQRRAVIEALLEDHELGADMARARIGIVRPGGPAPTAEQKVLSAVVGNLSRMSATQQKHHVASLVGALKSDEVKRQLRDRLNAELGDG